MLINTINLDANTRINVFTDDTPMESPAERYECIIYTVYATRGLRLLREGRPDVIRDLERIEYRMQDGGPTPDDVAAALVKHMERMGWTAARFAVDDHYDYRMGIVAAPEGYGTPYALRGDVERWIKSEWYSLHLERRHVWHDGAGATLETWDEIDQLYGVEFEDANDDTEVERYARWEFGIPEAA